MRPLMAASGHAFFAPTYTGLGERAHLARPGIDLETHVADVQAVLEVEDLHDVVLLAHSYGGIVGTVIASRASERIRQIVYVDAFVPRAGDSLASMVGPEQHAKTAAAVEAGDGWRIPPPPTPPDTAPEDVAWIAARRTPMPLACFEQPAAFAADPSVPRIFVRAMRNVNGPFGRFAARAQHEPGWRYAEIDASHSPNVTAPEPLMALLDTLIDR